MWKFFWSFGYNWCIWLSYDIMMHVLVRSHDEWSLLDRPRLLPQLPPALKERFGAPEEERVGHVGTPEHIGRLAGVWLSWSTNRHQQIISQRQSIFRGKQSWEFDSPKSSADHLSARHPCVSGSMAKKRPILFRLLVEPREIFQFPSLHYTNVDHCPKICKIFKLCSFAPHIKRARRTKHRKMICCLYCLWDRWWLRGNFQWPQAWLNICDITWVSLAPRLVVARYEKKHCGKQTLKTLEIVKGIVDPPHLFTRRLKTKWTWQVVQFQCFISS